MWYNAEYIVYLLCQCWKIPVDIFIFWASSIKAFFSWKWTASCRHPSESYGKSISMYIKLKKKKSLPHFGFLRQIMAPMKCVNMGGTMTQQAQTHKIDIKELAATKTDCCITSCCTQTHHKDYSRRSANLCILLLCITLCRCRPSVVVQKRKPEDSW